MDLLIWTFTDDNECENVTGICGPNATCNNTIGHYYCTCLSGFTSNGKQKFQTNDGTNCKGMNQSYTTEWVQKVSGHYIDLKKRKMYECQEEEYITNSIIVKMSSAIIWIADIDECMDAGRCGPFSKCHNTNGSFICSCMRGYTSPAGLWFTPKNGTDCRGENCKVTLCS